MMKKISGVIFCLLIIQLSFAQKISGTVSGFYNEPLSFASIVVKGTSVGVSANDSGEFSIILSPGNYTLQCGHVGYATDEQNITVTEQGAVVNFHLETILYHLNDVTVKSNAENPAYEIIRNAIKKRPDHEKEINDFQCQVYIKGQLQLRDYPNKFMGQKIDFEDGDTSKHKIIFLSETLANYYVQQPFTKIDVISTRVSGNHESFGFSNPDMISFYHNNVPIGKNLNQRGFISPIADDALKYYHYKFEGNFFDNGKMIDRIQVTPIRKYEPLFNGYINILEGTWRIYSLQFSLYKENEMQYLDTLKLEQTYVPVGDTWVLKQQVIYPSFKILGFNGFGNFVQVFDKYDLHPAFAKNFFNNTILKFYDSSNKKLSAYWDSVRPMPLQQEEVNDYQKKDSLEIARKNPHYLDSLDKIRNKFHIIQFITTGQPFYDTKAHFVFTEPALVNIANYNIVEGFNLSYSPEFDKMYANKQTLSLIPNVRYGFSNHHFNAHLTGTYNFGRKEISSLYFSGGRDVFQFNNDNPVGIFSNTIVSLIHRQNYMVIYQAAYGNLAYTKSLGDQFIATISSEYQDRTPLDNTTQFHIINWGDHFFTPNYPYDITNHNLTPDKALSATINLQWTPGARYIEYPDRRFRLPSKSPTFSATFAKGINNVFSSDVNYAKWSFGIIDTLNLKLAGRFAYHVTFGGFFNKQKLFIPDYNQYIGNRGTFASDYLNSYLLMYYYQFANTEPFYVAGHIEYHLNGFISNKIPLMKKYNWFFVLGANTLNISNSQYYYEGYLSVENIFKIARFDFIQAYQYPGFYTSGIRISVTGLLTTGQSK